MQKRLAACFKDRDLDFKKPVVNAQNMVPRSKAHEIEAYRQIPSSKFTTPEMELLGRPSSKRGIAP